MRLLPVKWFQINDLWIQWNLTKTSFLAWIFRNVSLLIFIDLMSKFDQKDSNTWWLKWRKKVNYCHIYVETSHVSLMSLLNHWWCLVSSGALTGGRLGPGELLQQRLRCGQVREAVGVLQAMDWSAAPEEVYGGLSAVTNHLLKLQLSADREGVSERPGRQGQRSSSLCSFIYAWGRLETEYWNKSESALQEEWRKDLSASPWQPSSEGWDVCFCSIKWIF